MVGANVSLADLVGASRSFVSTLIIGFLLDKTIGLRMKPDDELEGMDATLHAESAYEFGSGFGGRTLIGAGESVGRAFSHSAQAP